MKRGENTITRKSTDSSVTIPFERTFRNLDLNRPQDGDELSKFNFCGCGWPHHMLVPKGTPEGFPCYLFVMVSNHEDDKVKNQTQKFRVYMYLYISAGDWQYFGWVQRRRELLRHTQPAVPGPPLDGVPVWQATAAQGWQPSAVPHAQHAGAGSHGSAPQPSAAAQGAVPAVRCFKGVSIKSKLQLFFMWTGSLYTILLWSGFLYMYKVLEDNLFLFDCRVSSLLLNVIIWLDKFISLLQIWEIFNTFQIYSCLGLFLWTRFRKSVKVFKLK